tara:strand:+ start:34 stop:876 length:843 start_codon:yes stop_codon:yes gene_type:complete
MMGRHWEEIVEYCKKIAIKQKEYRKREANEKEIKIQREKIANNNKYIKLREAEEILYNNFERVCKENGIDKKIMRKTDIIAHVAPYYHVMLNKASTQELPLDIIQKILGYIQVEGISPIYAPFPNYNINVLIGLSFLGYPIGIWRIYTYCKYNDSGSKCRHIDCVSNCVDIMITDINIKLYKLTNLPTRPLEKTEKNGKLPIVMFHHIYKNKDSNGTKMIGIKIIKCNLSNETDFKIQLKGRRLETPYRVLCKLELKYDIVQSLLCLTNYDYDEDIKIIT